jgi:non-haem Fe2+, alpha-ketoglutarate-dependent halogenase
MPTLAMPRLTRQEVDGFYANGYTGPHAACSPEEMAAIRREVEENVLTTDGPWQKYREQMRHFDKRVVFDLCNNPEVVGRMASLLGNDLMVWRSNFFTKEPGGREIPVAPGHRLLEARPAVEPHRLDGARRRHD